MKIGDKLVENEVPIFGLAEITFSVFHNTGNSYDGFSLEVPGGVNVVNNGQLEVQTYSSAGSYTSDFLPNYLDPAIPNVTLTNPVNTYINNIYLDNSNSIGPGNTAINLYYDVTSLTVMNDIPEPTNWTLMLVGVVITGSALRGHRRQGFAY